MSAAQPATGWTKPPKDEWPTFILDLWGGADKPGGRWTIRKFEECEPLFYDKDKNFWNYSTISYAWGPWHDKRDKTGDKWPDQTNPAYPAFASNITPTWKFPIVNKNYAQGPWGPEFSDPVDPVFTIDDIKKTLTNLGTRFIWWDWACIPQGPWELLENLKLSNNPPIKAAAPGNSPPSSLAELQSIEVDKMRIIYPSSINGCLWLHQTTWSRDNKGIKGPVQQLLDLVNNMVLNQYNFTLDSVESFYGLLLAAQNSQLSLQSVWSFQEGVLYGAVRRPQKIGSTTCLILDHNGEAYGRKVDDLVGLQGGVGDFVGDIVNVSSRIVAFIGQLLAAKAAGVKLDNKATTFTRWVYGEDKKARDLMSRLISTGCVGYFYSSPITLLEAKWPRTIKCPWNAKVDRTIRAIIGALDIDLPEADLKLAVAKKKTDGNEGEYKALIGPYIKSLVQAYQWRLLLQARGKETPPAAASAAAALSAAVSTAATSVKDASAALTLASASGPALASVTAASTTATAALASVSAAVTAGLTGPAPIVAAPAAPAPAPASGALVNAAPRSWWSRFTDEKKPPFASLDYYIGSTKIEPLYQPRQARPQTLPTDVFDLPALEVAPGDALQLLAKKKDAYKFYNLASATDTKNWASCTFYSYAAATPPGLPEDKVDAAGYPHQPGTVEFVSVPFADISKFLGDRVVLLPFEKTKELFALPQKAGGSSTAPTGLLIGAASNMSTEKIKAFVLTDYDASGAQSKAIFRGVAEFANLAVDQAPFAKDLEIW